MKKEQKKISICWFWNKQKLNELKELLGWSLVKITSYNQDLVSQSLFINNSFSMDVHTTEMYLVFSKNHNSKMLKFYTSSRPDTWYGDLWNLYFGLSPIANAAIHEHWVDLSKYSQSQFSLHISEVIQEIEVRGVKDSVWRTDHEDTPQEESFLVEVDINLMLLFHFESGNKATLTGNSRDKGSFHWMFYNKNNLELLHSFLNKKNIFGEKIFNLRHHIK